MLLPLSPSPPRQLPSNPVVVDKATNPEVDSFSGFWDNLHRSQTSLNEELRAKGVTDVYVCGIAYDYCVGEMAMGLGGWGYWGQGVTGGWEGARRSRGLRVKAVTGLVYEFPLHPEHTHPMCDLKSH